MLTFAIERFADVYDELRPLLLQHYMEISTHVLHGVPLAPQVREYARREAAGQLMMLIGREQGKIVAYLVAFVGPGLHYETCLTAIVDIFYVQPTRRGALAGVKLLERAKQEWKRRGVQRAAAGAKLAHDASSLLKRCGFAPVETMHEFWFEG